MQKKRPARAATKKPVAKKKPAPREPKQPLFKQLLFGEEKPDLSELETGSTTILDILSPTTVDTKSRDYVVVDGEGHIRLTEKGEAIASRVYSRHRLLTQFFIRLGVSPEVAAADACKIEHDLSEETFEKIKAHAQQHGGVFETEKPET